MCDHFYGELRGIMRDVRGMSERCFHLVLLAQPFTHSPIFFFLLELMNAEKEMHFDFESVHVYFYID